MKVIAELMIIPIGVGASLSKYIAQCERILQDTNLKIQLHAEGTNIEGEWDAVMKAVKQCVEALHAMGVPRLMTSVRISTRVDKNETMEESIESVKAILSD